MIELLNYKDQNPSLLNLKFCKAELRGSSHFIPLKLNKNQPILIKTPKLYMPFQPKFQSSDSGYLRLSFDNLKIDRDVELFHIWIKSLEKHLHDSLSIDLKKKNLTSIIKQSHPYSDYFNINFDTNQLKIYNINLEPISVQDIKGKFYAYFVIQLSGMCYNTKQNNIRIVLDLIQFKLDNPKNAIQECLFLDEIMETKKEINLVKSHPKLASYIKMLNLGVPKFAVQQKMMITGTPSEYLDYLESDIDDLPPQLKKILEEYSSNNSNSETNSSTDSNVKSDENVKIPSGMSVLNSLNSLISSNLLQGGLNKLKKVEKDPESTLLKIKKMSGISSLPVPSLDQIKDALQNLKSVNESDKKPDY